MVTRTGREEMRTPLERKAYMKKWREENKDKIKAYYRDWWEKNTEKGRQYHKKFQEEHPETFKAMLKKNGIKNREKHPERVNVWDRSYKKRADACERCGAKDNLQFHHTDYAKNIGFTLCNLCHARLHRDERRNNGK
jgi:hypothetical protein